MASWVPIDVSTEHPYQVVLGRGALSLLPSFVEQASRVAIIHPARLTDVVTRITPGLPGAVLPIEIPDAEAAKTPAVLESCWNALADAGFTRSDAIVGLGGGATTDLAGFVAATWLRGVRYVALPTTVLAMVDAAVGGKTGINLPAGKNLVGAFYEPFTVLGDLDVLDTLDAREIRSGFAEVLKCGFIADPVILESFEADPEPCGVVSERLARLMRRAVAVKARVVADDLHERTSAGADVGREALNYGHTLAHAIERNEGFAWKHGEAVSIGMVFVAEVAQRLGLIDAELLARHRRVLAAAGLPVTYSGVPWEQLRATMGLDKKARGTHLRLVVLDGLARPMILDAPDEALLIDAFEALREV